MKPYQREFIEFAIAAGVLKFGSFTLKSGRVSPYFFNAGLFCTGGALARLGRSYAAALQDSGLKPDVLFGPAYKGYVSVSGARAGVRVCRDVRARVQPLPALRLTDWVGRAAQQQGHAQTGFRW